MTSLLTACSLAEATEPTDVGNDTVRFCDHLIMGGYGYTYGIGLGDLDGDGDLDITSADATPHNKLYWFENDGQGNFKKHLIQQDEPERLERHSIGDINGDGHLDVAIVKNLAGDLVWFAGSGKPGSRTMVTPRETGRCTCLETTGKLRTRFCLEI